MVGRAINQAEEDALYLRFCDWSWKGEGLRDMIWGKKFFESFWPETYTRLKQVVESVKPDLIFGDYLVDACRDVQRQYQLPLAVMYPQWPYFMCPVSYISGTPGLRMDFLTNENASMWARFNQEIYVLKHILPFIDLFRWTSKMRAELGLKMLPILRKPDHLVLVNALIGVETPKDVPPLVTAVGPILSDSFTQLDVGLSNFLADHNKTAFVAFGTHVVLSPARLSAMLSGLLIALEKKQINGVVWAIREGSKTRFATQQDRVIYVGPNEEKVNLSYADLLANRHSQLHFVDFAPQRAVLAHPSTHLFFTHGGPSSVNECVYHGVPMLVMGMFGDQLPRTLALEAAGVAESVKKENVTAEQIAEKISVIMHDAEGLYRRNVLRLQRVAMVASRRKALAADLVEEYMYDHELRFSVSRHDTDSKPEDQHGGVFDRGTELRPMHLETADCRMSSFRARNVDMWVVGLLIVAIFIAAMVLVGLGARSKL